MGLGEVLDSRQVKVLGGKLMWPVPGAALNGGAMPCDHHAGWSAGLPAVLVREVWLLTGPMLGPKPLTDLNLGQHVRDVNRLSMLPGQSCSGRKMRFTAFSEVTWGKGP